MYRTRLRARAPKANQTPTQAAQPHGFDLWLAANDGQGGAAIGLGIGCLAIEKKSSFAGNHRIGTGSLIGTATRREMRKVVGELVVDRARRRVVQRVLKDRARDAGVFVIEWNEGVPRHEGHVEWNGLVSKANLSEWEFAAEVALIKAWKPF